jgi:hypothetical protein
MLSKIWEEVLNAFGGIGPILLPMAIAGFGIIFYYRNIGSENYG